MQNNQSVADRIKIMTKSKNVTIKQMLSDIGLGFNTIVKLSHGTDILTRNMVKIADYLDCSVDYLLGRTDCPDLVVKDEKENTAFIEIMRRQGVYTAKIAASDGSFNKEITLTDSDIEKIDALPDVDDI